MTTAHRPTWAPAKGHEEQGGARMFGPSKKHSKLDDNAHTILKLRCVRARVLPSHARIRPGPTRASTPPTPQPDTPRPTSRRRADGQKSIKELMERDFRAELAEREAKHFKKKLGDGAAGPEDADTARLAAAADDDDDGPKFVPRDLDADDSDDSDSDDSDSDDDEDDTAALLAELERIKKERAADAARREAEEMQLRAQEKAEELATGNPLLHLSEGGDRGVDFTAKRRWDDDVVFKNQTRGEPQQKKRFVNDTIRSDFHRRFLNKYIK